MEGQLCGDLRGTCRLAARARQDRYAHGQPGFLRAAFVAERYDAVILDSYVIAPAVDLRSGPPTPARHDRRGQPLPDVRCPALTITSTGPSSPTAACSLEPSYAPLDPALPAPAVRGKEISKVLVTVGGSLRHAGCSTRSHRCRAQPSQTQIFVRRQDRVRNKLPQQGSCAPPAFTELPDRCSTRYRPCDHDGRPDRLRARLRWDTAGGDCDRRPTSAVSSTA